MSGVNAYLHQPDGTIIATAITDNQGYYQFSNLNNGNYTVTFITNQTAGGVELSDAFLVMLKLMNMITFTPIQTLAADVNGSGTITWTDYFIILIGYLTQGNPFPIGPWVFESTPITIPNPCRDGIITKAGSSSGDVSGSLQPDPKINSFSIETPTNNITSSNDLEPISINLTTNQILDIDGMYLSFRIPDNIEIIDIETPVPDANICITGDKVNVTWLDRTQKGFSFEEGSDIISIRVKAKECVREGQEINLVLDDKSHFIDQNGNLIQGASLTLPIIQVTFDKSHGYTVYPNPFMDKITFDLNLTEEKQVIVSMVDLTGRKVMELDKGLMPSGRQQIQVNCADLKPGVFQYLVTAGDDHEVIASGTLIKSK